VLAVALALIVIAAQAMFINDQDLRLLMWVLVPAVAAAAVAALFVARPVADDANRICVAAERVADGDLTARTGVRRRDELGEAAVMFDRMVERLAAVEAERALMLSAISHDLRTPLAALRAAVEALRDRESFQANEPCWCGSGRKYKRCHKTSRGSGAAR
jgi:signal transduction histidine kinase